MEIRAWEVREEFLFGIWFGKQLRPAPTWAIPWTPLPATLAEQFSQRGICWQYTQIGDCEAGPFGTWLAGNPETAQVFVHKLNNYVIMLSRLCIATINRAWDWEYEFLNLEDVDSKYISSSPASTKSGYAESYDLGEPRRMPAWAHRGDSARDLGREYLMA